MQYQMHIVISILSMLEKQKLLSPFGFFMLANVLLGTNIIAFKIATEGGMDPLFFTAMRFGLAGLIIIGFVWNYQALKNKRVLGGVIFNSLLLLASLVLWSYGLDQSTALKAALLTLSIPLTVYVLSIVILKEKVNKKALVGCLIGLSGSLMIVGLPALGDGGIMIGDIMLLAAYSIAALTVVHTKYLYKWLKPSELVAFRFSVSGVIALIYIFISQGPVVLTGVSLEGWLALIYGILLTGVVANLLFFWALAKINGEDASPAFYADPLTGALLAVVLLGDVLDIMATIGVAVVILGVTISHPYHHHTMYRMYIREHHYLHKVRLWLGNLIRHHHSHILK